MGWVRQAAFLALFALIALLAVALVSETGVDRADEIVLADEEEGFAPRVNEIQTAMGLLDDTSPTDNSKDAVTAALNDAANATRQGNKAARQAMREAAQQKTNVKVTNAVGSLQDSIVRDTEGYAQQVAQEVAKELKPASSEVGAEDGVNQLMEDTEEIEAAERNAEEQAQSEEEAAESKAEERKAELADKTKQIEEDFNKLSDEIDSYKGVHAKERSQHVDLISTMEKVRCLNQTLISTQERLKRMGDRHDHSVTERHDAVTHAKEELNQKLLHYKEVLKGLKDKLHAVQNATDINEQIASRIATAKGVVNKQEDKIAQLRTDVTSLEDELESTNDNIKNYTDGATIRKKALHDAYHEIDELTQAASILKEKIGQHADSITVNQTLGHAASTTASTGTTAVVSAVTDALVASKKQLRVAVTAKATEVATEAAQKLVEDDAAKEHEIQPPNLEGAVQEAGRLVSSLGLGNHTATSMVEPVALIEPVQDNDVDKALREATDTLSELHNSAKKDQQVHQAELFAHVAHTLYVKATKSGKENDAKTAKVAMRKALAARDGVKPA